LFFESVLLIVEIYIAKEDIIEANGHEVLKTTKITTPTNKNFFQIIINSIECNKLLKK